MRLNFNYFISEAEFDYLLGAIELVAKHGWRVLPYYEWDRVSGMWRFHNDAKTLPVSLTDLSFDQWEPKEGALQPKPPHMARWSGWAKHSRDAPGWRKLETGSIAWIPASGGALQHTLRHPGPQPRGDQHKGCPLRCSKLNPSC